jgi:uncharacterized protein
MARQPNPQDVSVDEIIASIRRIVADDDQSIGATAADSLPPVPPAGNPAGLRALSAQAMEDMLNFPPVNMGVPGTRTESQQSPAGASEDAERAPSEIVADGSDADAKRVRRRKSKTSGRRVTEHALLSRTAADAVDREFEALSRVVAGSWNARLDAMAREMVRPMLRVWLDRHLPKLVRQLVREEIARISGTSR